MPHVRDIYYRELRQLEMAFDNVKRHGVRFELDTDDVESVLEDWQDLIGDLYADGEPASRKLAQEIEAQLESYDKWLEDYIAERIRYEEEDAITKAGNRLTQSRIENYHNHLKQACTQRDAMRYYHVSSKLRVPDERPQPKKRSRLEAPPKSRLAIDED